MTVASGTSTAGKPESSWLIGDDQARTLRILGLCLVLCAAFQLHLASIQAINWDEFRFLSDVHAYQRGDLALAVQTFHVHFFGWLAKASANEVTQIIIARYVMLGVEAVTVWLIYAIARHFAEPSSAMLAALAFLSFSFVLRHGGSFRYDPMVTAMAMASAWLLLSKGHESWKAIAAGLLMAVAGLVTMKVIFYLPVLAAVALLRMTEARSRRNLGISYATGTLVGLIALAGLYAWHASTLGSANESGEIIAQSASKTLGTGALFPQWRIMVTGMLQNPVQWGLLLAGAAVAIRDLTKAGRGDWIERCVPLAFMIPLATVAIYRNAYPYFYVFMLAPAVLLIATHSGRIHQQRLVVPLAIVMTAGAFFQYLSIDRAVFERQRATISAVHEIFPTPVPFIDHGSMPASFVQAGFFMSTWGMDNYHARGVPVMRAALAERGAVFLIDNKIWLSSALQGEPIAGGLLPEDASTLRDNFVHHWGPIWVVGKTLTAGQSPSEFEILVTGTYTLEADGPVQIDGHDRNAGTVLELGTGWHSISSSQARKAVLRWGKSLNRPQRASTPGALFDGL